MKKKNTIVAVLATVTLLGGAGFAYNQAFASNSDEQPTTNYESSSVAEVQITTPTIEEGTPLAETPEGQLAERKQLELEDIGEVNIPLNLDTSSVAGIMSTNETENNPIVELVEVQASENIYGKEVYATYRLAEGQEIFISQSEDVLENEQATVELAKSWYDPNNVSTQEINGATAVIENGETRKTVHLIKDDVMYTICSNGADNLDQLIEIANGIQP
ncbi:hypothetical protein SAMN05428961_110106 [Paenibacillus sp. OK060]|uniref:hypothetical protein n=1 Tax=Paenibacillus sp. OK060 TaxID=1881034 RepID=UPI00089209CF|nr:hypothetical protein [Paenibacillus sp. OK060]SDM15867.1 hypothetical protein SAMN05428961_110106 [Paenibacillus sp. OK060]